MYDDIWFLLNEPKLKPIPESLYQEKHPITFHNAFDYFKRNAHLTIINLQKLSNDDRRYLALEGISLNYLYYNLRKTVKGRHLDALDFQITALRNKAVYAFCPFTKQHVESRHSLLANINVIFYRFNCKQVFYVITAGLNGFKKNALYFPKQELLVISGIPWGFEEADLFELKARVTCNWKLCHQYLATDGMTTKKIAVCIGFFHFAHHLWNELPGINRLHRRNLFRNVDKFLVLREPLGDIRQIFPEILPEKIARQLNIGEMFEEIMRNHYFVVRVGDYFVAKDVVSRVYRVAKANCVSSTLGEVEEARKRYWPLLWVGIRVGSRTWINQADGLAKVIKSLHADFPRLGVVFDGFSLPADRAVECSDNREYGEILDQENGIVAEIIERLQPCGRDMPGIFNIIGSSVFDANVWANAIDVYVSPYGTLQHKVGWFANKPGIVHANETLLANPGNHIWTAVDNAVKPRYVTRGAVTDVRKLEQTVIYRELSDLSESGAGILATVKRIQEDPQFDNYEVDCTVLSDELLRLVRSPNLTRHLDLSVLAERLKKRIKRVVHGLINILDYSKI